MVAEMEPTKEKSLEKHGQVKLASVQWVEALVSTNGTTWGDVRLQMGQQKLRPRVLESGTTFFGNQNARAEEPWSPSTTQQGVRLALGLHPLVQNTASVLVGLVFSRVGLPRAVRGSVRVRALARGSVVSDWDLTGTSIRWKGDASNMFGSAGWKAFLATLS